MVSLRGAHLLEMSGELAASIAPAERDKSRVRAGCLPSPASSPSRQLAPRCQPTLGRNLLTQSRCRINLRAHTPTLA